MILRSGSEMINENHVLITKRFKDSKLNSIGELISLEVECKISIRIDDSHYLNQEDNKSRKREKIMIALFW